MEHCNNKYVQGIKKSAMKVAPPTQPTIQMAKVRQNPPPKIYDRNKASDGSNRSRQNVTSRIDDYLGVDAKRGTVK